MPHSTATPPRPPLASGQVPLAPEGDSAATRAWEGHVAAGRIGLIAPLGPPGDYGLAGLASLLGHRALRDDRA